MLSSKDPKVLLKKLLKFLDYGLILLLILVGIFIFFGGFHLPEDMRLPLGVIFLIYAGLRFILIKRKYKREDKPNREFLNS